MNEKKICCFTGHRDYERAASPLQKIIFERLVDNLIRAGYTTFVAGGAVGFDMAAAEYILQKKKELGLRLELVIPCADQADRWSPPLRARYQRILDAADSVECLYPRYTSSSCMIERNRRMVDKSHACVAFCQRDEGGSAYTVRYAKSRGIDVYNIVEMARL